MADDTIGRKFAALLGGLGRGVFGTTWGPVRAHLDRLDERRARKLREACGRRLRLVSWVREPNVGWRARLSGPGVERTIERTGRTRVRAAESASTAMDRVLKARHALRNDPALPGRDFADEPRRQDTP